MPARCEMWCALRNGAMLAGGLCRRVGDPKTPTLHVEGACRENDAPFPLLHTYTLSCVLVATRATSCLFVSPRSARIVP